MSTQQLGDRPPGESRGAGGGRCNRNAPAWDPEKMELCRMVDRLLEVLTTTQAGGAGSASQGEAAAILGEGLCHLELSWRTTGCEIQE